MKNVLVYEIENIEAKTIISSIEDTLRRFKLPFPKVRGHCYDMGVSMAGAKNGIAAQIRKIEPRANFTHCYGHSLSLACADFVRKCKLLREALDVTKEITKLKRVTKSLTKSIKESRRREAIFRRIKSAQDIENSSQEIKVLCQTRWTIKADAFKSIIDNYSTLQEV